MEEAVAVLGAASIMTGRAAVAVLPHGVESDVVDRVGGDTARIDDDI